MLNPDESSNNDDTTCQGKASSGMEKVVLPVTRRSKRRRNRGSVRSVKSSTVTSDSLLVARTTSLTNDHEQSSKRQRTEASDDKSHFKALVETEALREVRSRTFSHWPHRTSPSREQLIEAGFFNCNVGDRTICLYCNLICQQWTSQTDNPLEVHKTLSPQCPYVLSMFTCPEPTSILMINANPAADLSSATVTLSPFCCNELALTPACNVTYISINKRRASFATWLNEDLPSVEDLVCAGFFYTGTKTIVRCFYCNGSIENWNSNDNPRLKHAHCYPDCAYAKQVCDDDLYRKTQSARQGQTEATTELMNISNTNSKRLQISNESTLSCLVANRISLPMSQNLLNRNFKMTIIKRCWEDQLRLKYEDFLTENDLFVACIILQKQIELIAGKKENIILPGVQMRLMREKEQSEILAIESIPSVSTTIPESIKAASSTSANCVVCLVEEKRLACIPCGHLATCIPCGHLLRTCPICRREIQAFVRIFT